MEYSRTRVMGSDVDGDHIDQTFDGTYLINSILSGGLLTAVSAIDQDGGFIFGDPATNGSYQMQYDVGTGYTILSRRAAGTFTPFLVYTSLGGVAIPMTHGAGVITGNVVKVDAAGNGSIPIDAYNITGIAGVAGWVIIKGIAEVLLDAISASAVGNMVLSAAAPNLGTGNASITPANINALTLAQYMTVLGTALEIKAPGALCKVHLK